MKQSQSLFVRPDEQIVASAPAWTRQELELKYESYQVKHAPSLGFYSDDDDANTNVNVHEQLTVPIEPPFVIQNSYSCPPYALRANGSGKTELANSFMRDNPDHPATKWLKDNAASLNHARRWYAVQDLQHTIQEKEDQLRRARLKLNIDIVELNTGRNLTVPEKQVLVLEFGGSEKDF